MSCMPAISMESSPLSPLSTFSSLQVPVAGGGVVDRLAAVWLNDAWFGDV